MRTRSLRRLVVLLVAVAAVSACHDDFTPIAPSELEYSIFGVLDAAADTQWIRVAPIRHTVVSPPNLPKFHVTLENLGTGQIIEMRDTVIRFSRNTALGSEGVFLNHAWTTERIEPGATYRFTARRDGGPVAEAVVTVPPEIDVEVWRGPGGDLLRLSGIRHLAFVRALTHFYDGCGTGVQVDRYPILPNDSDEYEFPLDPTVDEREDCGEDPPIVEDREIWIVGSGEPWPVTADFNPWKLDLPDVSPNISHAVGFLGGVLTRTVPYEECVVDGAGECVLRYDDAAATLTGTVTDARCGGPIPRVTVRLVELDPEPGRGRIARVAYATREGAYRIGALDPGKRYELTVRRIQFENDLPVVPAYDAHADTLTFTPGERLVYDVALERFDPC